MAEQQRLREEKEVMERARAEQEESERLQRQVSPPRRSETGSVPACLPLIRLKCSLPFSVCH